MREVFVVGTNHHNTLGVIRALGRRGIMPIVILTTNEKKPFVSYSRYIKQTIKVSDENRIPDVLLSEHNDRSEKAVVICCSDSSSGIVDANYDRLLPFFMLPGANKQGRISTLMSKREMSNLASTIGMKVPISLYNNVFDVEVPIPCILKPLISMKGSKSDIHICYSQEELKKYISLIGKENVQIQEFIEKDFEYQLIGCATSKDIIIPGLSKILRPCKNSNTSFLHYMPLEDGFCDIEKCKKFVSNTGYHGLFSLEFIRDKNGCDYFMEINFRNDGNAICVTAAGVNLPYIWYLDCIGENYESEMMQTLSSVYVMPDMAELKLLLTRQLSLSDFISDWKKTDYYMEYDKLDPKPFWRLIRSELHLW